MKIKAVYFNIRTGRFLLCRQVSWDCRVGFVLQADGFVACPSRKRDLADGDPLRPWHSHRECWLFESRAGFFFHHLL